MKRDLKGVINSSLFVVKSHTLECDSKKAEQNLKMINYERRAEGEKSFKNYSVEGLRGRKSI